ncbi:MAG: hypothetical protein OXB84_03370, partial [Halobacteriovoraceae bacterium]|nr:hypothetical protein [Halobacteriovoraceae bacterium]
IKSYFKEIPSHIKIISPEDDISTYSLYGIIDYCLTIRGTCGIEAALLGKRVLTAGTGGYSGRGFTYDFDSKEEYLKTVNQIEKVPPMSDVEIQLAEKYAYGLFILRPLPLDLIKIKFSHDEVASFNFRFKAKTLEEFKQSKFVTKIQEFVHSNDSDMLL